MSDYNGGKCTERIIIGIGLQKFHTISGGIAEKGETGEGKEGAGEL